MKKSRFTNEEKMLYVKAMSSGTNPTELARQLGLGRATLYRWRDRFGDRDIEEVERYQRAVAENRALKQMVAELTLELKMVKAVLAKKN